MTTEKKEEEKITITVKTSKRDYIAILRRPLFQEQKMAYMALQSNSGKADILGAGSTYMTTCWVGGDEVLKNGESSKDPVISDAYCTACVDAYHNLGIAYESEVKKN